MNRIEKIRSEIQQYFKPDNEIANSDETIISPALHSINQIKNSSSIIRGLWLRIGFEKAVQLAHTGL